MTDNKIIEADAVIIATGATAKYLGLESETKYAGMGVSACATCDGFFYKGKDVAVVGGGDTAAEEATYLAGLCNKVYLIVRRNVLRASKAMQEKVIKTANIEILWEHQTVDLFGENGVEGATLVKKKGTPEEEIVKIKIDGFFLAIGHTPNSDVFKKYILKLTRWDILKLFPVLQRPILKEYLLQEMFRILITVRLSQQQVQVVWLQLMPNVTCQSIK